MFYDLNVPWAPGKDAELQRTLAFSAECELYMRLTSVDTISDALQ